MTDIDILKIDKDILDGFQAEADSVKKYEKNLVDIEACMKIKDLDSHVYNDLQKKKEQCELQIKMIQTKEQANFYIAESHEILSTYKNLLDTPMKLSFIGKKIKSSKEKDDSINQYITVANKYLVKKLPYITCDDNTKLKNKNKIICDNCKNSKDFSTLENNIYICLSCFAQKIIIKHVSSFNDTDRINISSKYCYDRKIHFRDTLNQYQGKQNCTINDKVYQDLEKEFESHYLLIGDKNTPKIERYKNITKEVIMIFLKDLDYTKHYENLNLIYYIITGNKPDDIGYLEDKLLADFDLLTEIYDKKYKDIVVIYGYDEYIRKNFIHTHFILFQLLFKYKHPCKKEDFSMLKTIDRITFHDVVTKYLFEELNWNYSPFM